MDIEDMSLESIQNFLEKKKEETTVESMSLSDLNEGWSSCHIESKDTVIGEDDEYTYYYGNYMGSPIVTRVSNKS